MKGSDYPAIHTKVQGRKMSAKEILRGIASIMLVAIVVIGFASFLLIGFGLWIAALANPFIPDFKTWMQGITLYDFITAVGFWLAVAMTLAGIVFGHWLKNDQGTSGIDVLGRPIKIVSELALIILIIGKLIS